MCVPQNCLSVSNLSFVPFVFARIVTVQLPVLDEAVVDLFILAVSVASSHLGLSGAAVISKV